jgi:arylsulfatase
VGTLVYNNFSGLAQPGTGILKVDRKVVTTKRMEKPPFPLTAKFNKLTIKVDRPQLSPADIKKLEEAMKEKAKSD